MGIGGNWASEASPTLGCSIEISRDICRYVCRSWSKSVGGNTWAKRAHAQSQYWAVKSDGKIRPVTPVLLISTIRYRLRHRREKERKTTRISAWPFSKDCTGVMKMSWREN